MSKLHNRYLPQTDEGLSVNLKNDISDTAGSATEDLPGAAQVQRVFKVNFPFLMLYALIASMGMFQLGYVYTATNQTASTLDVQFNLAQDEKNFYHTVIGSSAVLGAAIGSFVGGKLIQYGRRRMMLIFNFAGILAVGSTLFLNVYAICFGRLVFGFCGGIFGVALPRMIEETVPSHLLGPFGIVTNLSVNTGGLVAILMGAGLPEQTDIEGMRSTNFWRIIFGLPWIFQAFTIPALLFILRWDSIKFLLDHGQDPIALTVIKRVYHKTEDHLEILSYLKQTYSKTKSASGSGELPLKEAIFGQRYWRATWFCIAFIIFGQFTGVNAIMWYSNSIIKRMHDEGGGISPRLGTILIGLAGFFGALCAMFPARYFGRKTLVLTGHCLMGVFLTLVGVFSYNHWNNAALAMIMIFLITYQMSDGSITYLYVTEVVTDGALGVCFLALKGTALVISLTTEYIMDSPLHPYGAFWMYGGFATLGGIFSLIFMRETRGLTDKAKKELYAPAKTF